MKSQSLEVLSEIRKTLSVLSIQIEKLSAALEELEDAEETAVPEAEESEVEADYGVSSEPETLSQEESQTVAEGEEAVSLHEIEDLPEVEAVDFPQGPVFIETTDESLPSEASESPVSFEPSDDLPQYSVVFFDDFIMVTFLTVPA